MPEERVCSTEDCDRTAGETGLCSGCEFRLMSDVLAGIGRINDYLRLEAEFIAYCAANGLPHPHDK